jgi:hypothetical protein
MNPHSDLKTALDEVSASSAGGSPFLIAYGATFIITAILSLVLPRTTAALIAMFQGTVALPLAFWLERRMGSQRMSTGNPLRDLSALMAVSQALGIPALIVVFSLNPAAVPVVLAGLGGVPFLPSAWLHRTRLYIFLGAAAAIGAFVIQIMLGAQAFSVILFYVGIVYWIFAPLLVRHASQIVREQASLEPQA